MSDSNLAYQSQTLVRARIGTAIPPDGPNAYQRRSLEVAPDNASLFSRCVRRFAWLLVWSVAAFILLTLPELFPGRFQRTERPDLPRPILLLDSPLDRALLPPPIPSLVEYRISHTVRKGQTFGSIFADYGLDMLDATAVQAQLKVATETEKDVRAMLDAGQQLVFELAADGRLQSVRGDLRRDTLFSVKRTADGTFAGELEMLPKKPAERMIIGEIRSSFSAAAREAGASFDAVDDFVDLFSDRVAFHKDFRQGDRFSIVYQDTELSDGTSLGEGAILAAAIEVNGKPYYAIRYVGSDGVSRYFDEFGQTSGDSFLRYPLKFSRISSHFSKSRFHPVLKKSRPHNGVDFAAPTGTPVRSVADGLVEVASARGGSGLMVKLKHGERYATDYLHLSSIAKEVRVGSRVKRGQVIGAVGMTGLATGPHLHFGFYDRGKYVDPLTIKLPQVDELNPSQRIDAIYLQRVLFTLHHFQRLESHEIYSYGGTKPRAVG